MAAILLPNGEQQFFDNNGNPLASGEVYFYIPNTTSPKATWEDAGKITQNTNPVILDSAGQAATLQSAGPVKANFLSIKDSAAMGPKWCANNSTNVSGNSGWQFGNCSTSFKHGGRLISVQ